MPVEKLDCTFAPEAQAIANDLVQINRHGSPRDVVEDHAAKVVQLARLVEKMAEAIDRLQSPAVTFKTYVHARLDNAGVPHDPDPEQTKATGCRIGGRLDWLLAKLDEQDAPPPTAPRSRYDETLARRNAPAETFTSSREPEKTREVTLMVSGAEMKLAVPAGFLADTPISYRGRLYVFDPKNDVYYPKGTYKAD